MNVSRTGVLFTGPPPFPGPGSELEFVMALPSLGLRGCPQVECQGRVVRHVDHPTGVPAALAVTIDSYRLLGSDSGVAVGAVEA